MTDALRRTDESECVIDPTIVSRLLARKRERGPLDVLTEREREVLALVAEGRSNGAIADEFFLSRKRGRHRSQWGREQTGRVLRLRPQPVPRHADREPGQGPDLTAELQSEAVAPALRDAHAPLSETPTRRYFSKRCPPPAAALRD